MAKLVLNDLANLQNEQSAVNTINQNNSKIEQAVDKLLSRDGAAPNEMQASIDMNSHRIYNLPKPVGPTEPIRREDTEGIFDLYDGLSEALLQADVSAAASQNSAMASAASALDSANSAQAAADAAASVSGAFSTVDTIATAQATVVPSGTDYLIVAGQTVPGIGGGMYRRLAVAPVPVEPWHFQSADGSYWTLSELEVNADMFGVAKDGIADDTSKLQDMVNYASSIGGATCYIPPGTYKISQVDMKSNVSIECSRNTVFNSIAGWLQNCFSWIGTTSGSAYLLTANPTPTWNADTLTLSAPNAANFSPGDKIVIRDNTFVASPYGRNQEFAEVLSVSGTTIVLKSSLVNTYTTANSTEIIKLSPVENSHFSGGRFIIPISKVDTTISTTSGSPTTTVGSASGLVIGMVVETVNVTPTPSFATVSNIVGTTVTLSGNAAATGSSVAASFHKPTGGCLYFKMAINCSVKGSVMRNISGLPAVSVYQSRNISVENTDARYGQALTIAGFSYGIDIDDSSMFVDAVRNHSEKLRENVVSTGAKHINIMYNTCKGMQYNGWNTHAAGCTDVVIHGNQIVGTQNGSGIAVGYTSGYTADSTVTISNNIIKNSNEAGIQISGGSSYTSSSVTITGNIISGYGRRSSSTFKVGIWVYKTNQVIISDNLIQGGSTSTGTTAISLNTAVVCKVNDNIIEGVWGTGVSMTGSAYAHIDMNHFRNVTDNNVAADGTNSVCTVRFNRADTSTVNINAAVSQAGNSWN